MKYTFYLLTLFALLSGCQPESTQVTPEFINFEAVANNADEITTGRKTEAFRGKVSLTSLENELVIIADQADEGRSLAYVLQTENGADFQSVEFATAWVVFLQDHLLIFDERSDRRIRLSIKNRELDSSVVNESITFTEVVNGAGLARYADQTVRKGDLASVNSYLEARSKQ